MKKLVLLSVIFVAVLLSGFFLFNSQQENVVESKDYNEEEDINIATEELDPERLVGINPEELTEEQERELNLELLRIDTGRIELNSEEAKQQRLNEIFAMLGTTEEEYQAKIEKQHEELTFQPKNDLGPDKYVNLPPREKYELIKNSLTPEDIETANRVAPYMDNIKEAITKTAFRWTQELPEYPQLAEGAERVRVQEDTIIITSFKGLPGVARWSMNKDALEHQITAFYMVTMEFENGDEEEILVEQRLSDAKRSEGGSLFIGKRDVAISHEIENFYHPLRIITRWIDESE